MLSAYKYFICIYLFIILLCIVDVKAQCPFTEKVNVVFIYAGPYYYYNGYISGHEASRIEIKKQLIQDECSYESSFYDNVEETYESLLLTLNDSMKADSLNIYVLTSSRYRNPTEYIIDTFCAYFDCKKYDIPYFILRSGSDNTRPNIVTYNTHTYLGIAPLACQLVLDNVRLGAIVPFMDAFNVEMNQVLNYYTMITDENDLNNITIAQTLSYEDPLSLNASIQFLNNTDVNCVLYNSVNTIFSNIFASNRNLFSIGLYYDVRKFVSESNSSNSDYILFSIVFDYSELLKNIIIKIANEYPNLSHSNFFGTTTKLVGFSSRFSLENITYLLESYEEMQAGLIGKIENGNCKINFDGEIKSCYGDAMDMDMMNVTSVKVSDNIIPVVTHISDPEGIVLTILTSIGIFLVILSGIDLFIHWSSNVYKSSSNFFLLLSLIGIMLQFISVFLWIGKPNDAMCVLRFWLFGIGYSLLFSCIFAKNYRVWRIFKSKKLRQTVILDIHLLLYFVLVIVGIEIIFLAIWTGVSMPVLDFEQVHDLSSLEHYCACKIDTAFGIIFIALKFLLLLPVIFVSYQTKDIEKRYRETQTIAFSVYNAFIVGILISSMVGLLNSNVIKSNIISYGIFFIAIITYIVTFIPKHYELYFKKEENASTAIELTSTH